MSVSFNEAARIQLAGGIVRPGIFFRLDTTPPVRIWGGAGLFSVPPDSVETEGGTYIGWGELKELPALQQLINGVATRVDFVVSGISEVGMRLADEEAENVRGKAVNIGILLLDQDWQPVSEMTWLGDSYEADVMTLDSRLEGDIRVETLVLSVASTFTGRRRPRYKHYTDAEQRRRSPDDRYCERVTVYAQQYTKTWPRY